MLSKKDLINYPKVGIKLGLEAITELLDLLGNPQYDYDVIHVAGTNGKGSTCAFINEGLIASGYKVGKYSSPFIHEINEEFVINNRVVSDEKLIAVFTKVQDIIQANKLSVTYYELTTAIMFELAKQENVDFLVLEVGLGGRLDATNVCNAKYCVITNVSVDHTNFLGNTIKEIAPEKFGIIKPESVVFLGRHQEELEQLSSTYQNQFILAYEQPGTCHLDYKTFQSKVTIDRKEYKLSLFGEHQFENFRTARAVLKYLKVSEENIAKAAKNTKWDYRFDIRGKDRNLILDGAHNLDSAKKLADNLKPLGKEKVIVLFSALEDKDIKGISNILSDVCCKIVVCSLSEDERGLCASDVYEQMDLKVQQIAEVIEDENKAFTKFNMLSSEYKIVCGSFNLLRRFEDFYYNL